MHLIPSIYEILSLTYTIMNSIYCLICNPRTVLKDDCNLVHVFAAKWWDSELYSTYVSI